MVKKEYKRLLFSYATIILVAAETALACVSYYFSYLQRNVYINEYNTGAEDLNLEAMKNLIDSYNGFKYFFTYYEYSEEAYVGIILAFAWLGIFLSCLVCRWKENGYGNFLVSRKGYAFFFKNMLAAQSLYIATVLGIIFALQLLAAFAVGGLKTPGYLSHGSYLSFLIIFCLYLINVFYFVSINIIVSSLSCFIRNKYVLQAFPVLVFALLPLLAADVLPAIFTWADTLFSHLMVVICPFEYLLVIVSMMRNFYSSDLAGLFVSFGLFALCSVILAGINVTKLKKDFI